MKRKIGLALNCLPVGVMIVLLEYHGIISPFVPRIGYIAFIVLIPVLAILLIRDGQQRGFYRLLFLSYVVSLLLSFGLFILSGPLPSYWIKPFSTVGLGVFLPTFSLMIELTLLFIMNLFKGFVEILKTK